MGNSSFDLFNKLNTSELLAEVAPLIIIADNLRTPENVGMVLRLAGNINACLTLFLNEDETNFKPSKIKRTSSGAYEKVNWKIIKPYELAQYLPKDYNIIALETSDDAINITNFKFPNKTALMVGNEVLGISSEILNLASQKVYIPIPGVISSLNVTHSLSIAVYEWMKQFSI